MRIKSNYKDYYDCMARYDDDHVTLFLRKGEKPQEVDYACYLVRGSGPFGEDLSYDSHVICFCGKIYPILQVTKNGKSSLVYSGGDWESLLASLPSYDKHSITRFFEIHSQQTDSWSEEIEKYGPIFVFSTRESIKERGWGRKAHWLKKNPKLSDYGFAKIMPPEVAYNELWKYVCNMQRPPMPIPEMSNDVKIHQAGFDNKTSFRKPKSKK